MGFSVDPRVTSSRDFDLKDESYQRYLVLCSIPGIAFAVIVLLVLIISGCTKCVRRICCSRSTAEGEEGIKLPKAYFDSTTGLSSRLHGTLVCVHVMLSAGLVLAMALALVANAKASDAVDTTFSVVSTEAAALANTSATAVAQYNHIEDTLLDAGLNDTLGDLGEEIDQVEHLSSSLHNASVNIQDSKDGVNEYDDVRAAVLLATFGLAAAIGIMCAVALCVRKELMADCGVWWSFLPLFLIGLLFSLHWVAAVALSDLCPEMDRDLADFAPDKMEADVTYMLTCTPTVNGAAVPFANTTLGQALHAVDDAMAEANATLAELEQIPNKTPKQEDQIDALESAVAEGPELSDAIRDFANCHRTGASYRRIGRTLCSEGYESFLLVCMACCITAVCLASASILSAIYSSRYEDKYDPVVA